MLILCLMAAKEMVHRRDELLVGLGSFAGTQGGFPSHGQKQCLPCPPCGPSSQKGCFRFGSQWLASPIERKPLRTAN